jgi:hypothetical protein
MSAAPIFDLTGILGQVDADRLLKAIYLHDARTTSYGERVKLRECHLRAVARQAGIADDVPLVEPITLFGRPVDVVAEPDLFPVAPVVSFVQTFQLYDDASPAA